LEARSRVGDDPFAVDAKGVARAGQRLDVVGREPVAVVVHRQHASVGEDVDAGGGRRVQPEAVAAARERERSEAARVSAHEVSAERSKIRVSSA
jgi:hypothetical protein